MREKKNIALIGASGKGSIENALTALGFTVFVLPENKRIESSISGHADLSLFLYEKNAFVSEDYYRENADLLDNIAKKGDLHIIPCTASPHSPYPHDVPYCILQADEKSVISNQRYIAPQIADFLNSASVKIISTPQGYAKCTALAFHGRIISADRSILKAASSQGFTTLEILSGGIDLPGYDYGFIGGASGFDGKNIYFCGDISIHPNAYEIDQFIRNAGYSVVSLTSGRLTDIGSIFFI